MLRLAASLIAAALVAGVLATEARADPLTIDLDGGIAGQPSSPTPSGTPTITFEETGTAGVVRVTMSLEDLTGNEKVSDWYFNCSLDTSLSIAYDTGTGTAPSTWSPSVGYNSTASTFKADGSGGYHDIVIHFSVDDNDKFSAGETAVFLITGTGLTVADFDTFAIPSANNEPSYRSVAHILGLSGGASIYVGDVGTPVPEPGTALLLSLGLAGVAAGARRRSRRRSRVA